MLLFCLSGYAITISAQEGTWDKLPVTLIDSTSNEVAILRQLEIQTGLSFAYPGQLLSGKKRAIRVDWREVPLKQALSELFPDPELVFKKIGNSLIIRPENRKEVRFHLNGYITDAATGEALIGATVSVEAPEAIGTASNAFGYYTLALVPGQYRVRIAYLGYRPEELLITFHAGRRVNIRLEANAQALQEVVVRARPADQVQPAKAGQHRIDIEQLNTLPTIGGEADVLKAIQMLPGINQAGEGSSGLYVRGGNLDQNLILLDDAPIYHASHLLGFFSTFHPDAIRHADMYTGNFPVRYGGRLSSVLNLRMKEGNRRQFSASGGLGLLASRLLLEGPIKQEKHSFMIAARRTYPDIFLDLFSNDDGGNKANFYDLNAKVNFTVNANNRIFFSAYRGQDIFRFFDAYENTWGNTTATIRWNRIFSEKLFANFTAVYSRYQYVIDNLANLITISSWESGVRDLNLKADFTYTPTANNRLYFGLENILHRFEPGKDRLQRFGAIPTAKTLEQAIYLGHHRELGRWTLGYGLRINANHNLGSSTLFRFDDHFQLQDSLYYGPGIFHSKFNLAPRLSVQFRPSAGYRLSLGYSRTVQYIQELRNTTTGFNAFYTFLPSSPNLSEQKADQLSLGVQRSFQKAGIITSVEVYYKWLHNQLDFAPHSQLLQNPLVEGSIRSGKGRAYGLELNLEKIRGELTGGLSYTYARSFRTIPAINSGKTYPVYYDQPHNLKLQLSYQRGKRWQFAASWQYHSGGATTLPIGSFQYDGTVIPIYGERNAARLPDFHRMDLSATLHSKVKPERRYRHFWVLSIYNAYFKKNTLSIDVLPRREPDSGNVPDPTDVAVYRTYLLGIVPSVAYHFKF